MASRTWLIISLGGSEPRPKGHVAANLNVGNGRDALLADITDLLPPSAIPAASTRSGYSTR
jgi:4-carboxymuconolactone decarboxylase